MIRLGVLGAPDDNYSIVYPPNPILIIKAPILAGLSLQRSSLSSFTIAGSLLFWTKLLR